MKIQVTSDDIKNGEPRNSRACPVAIAMTRATGKPVSVVYFSFAVLDTPEKVEKFDLAKMQYFGKSVETKPGEISPRDSVSEFNKRFDEGLKVEPFEFQVVI